MEEIRVDDVVEDTTLGRDIEVFADDEDDSGLGAVIAIGVAGVIAILGWAFFGVTKLVRFLKKKFSKTEEVVSSEKGDYPWANREGEAEEA